MNVSSEFARLKATRIAVFFTFAFTLTATGAAAQDKAAMEAIKSNCRSDYMANCMSVSPGGKEALQCLQKNLAKLSPACSSAVSATMAKSSPVPAAAPPPPAERTPAAAKASAPPPKRAAAPSSPSAGQMDAIKANCRSDYMAKCGSVPPGGTEALQCMQRNVTTLSPACRTAVSATMPKTQPPTAAKPKKAKATATAAPNPALPAAAAAPPSGPAISMARIESMPLPRRLAVIGSCSYDKNAVCPLVKPGDSRIVVCLAQHLEALSPPCKRALLGALQ